MFNLIKTAALATVIAIGALGAASTSAKADALHIGFKGHGTHIGIGVGGGGYWHGGHRGHRGHHYRGCTPHRAVEKARHMGVRHARVAHVSQRTIQVRGHRHGHPTRVTFARAPHCPVIRY